MSEAELQRLLKDLRREAGWENTSGALAAAEAIADLPGDAPLLALVKELDRVDSIDLSDDAGDVGDEVARTRYAVLGGLMRAGPRVAPVVFPLLHREHVTQRNVTLATALARLGHREVGPIVEAWITRPDTELLTKIRLVELLGLVASPNARELIHALLREPHEVNAGWLKRMSALALAHLQDVAGLEVLLDDEDWFARLGVMEACRHLRDARAVAALRARGATDLDERVRKAAAS
ncbi:MAG: hypothetical protein U0228_01745 [Myxococcaceae bacterium]